MSLPAVILRRGRGRSRRRIYAIFLLSRLQDISSTNVVKSQSSAAVKAKFVAVKMLGLVATDCFDSPGLWLLTSILRATDLSRKTFPP